MKTKKLFTLLFVMALAIQGSYGQINPYLQTPTPSSIWVSWKTGSGTESTVEYGTSSSNLNQSAGGSTETMSSNWYWHKVNLSGLQPNTAYYYRVKTGSQYSSIKRFRTQPAENTSTGHYRFIILGDHQRYVDNRYQVLVNAAKAKAESLYGGPVEDVVNLVVNAGDQVNTGTNLSQWENTHFNQGAALTGNVPSVTVVGNHDQGGGGDGNIATYARLFTYADDAGFAYGTPGTHGDNYYAFKVANMVFICMNSNQSWTDQTNWVQDIVSTATADSNVDWIFSDCHHPLWAEELPGDASSYMKNSILPSLKSSPKMAMYISGHAHLYARGALREEPVYHIINGGASWDQLWTDNTGDNTDYEEVQKTIDRQVFQIVDIDMDARTMQVETYSIGSSKLGGGFNEDRLIDSYYLKLDGAAPNTPSLAAVPASITLPHTFTGNTYSGAEPYNSTEFQFAGPNGDFDNPIHRVKRDFENIYGNTYTNGEYVPTNHNAGVDIFKVDVFAANLYQGTNYVRVRYRDQSMHWSEWSSPVAFETTNGQLTPPEEDPIAYWPFDGNTNDISVEGNNFSAGSTGGATYIARNGGQALDFDNGDMITIQSGGSGPNGLPARELTVAGWVRVDAADAWGGFIGCVQDNGSDESGWLLGTRGNYFSFALASQNSGSLTYLTAPGTFNTNQWYHVAATYNGSMMRLYVDGAEVSSSTDQSGNIEYPGSAWFQIGSYKDDNEDFRHDGGLDDMVMWERALTAAEVLDLFQNGADVGTPTPVSDTVAYYQMDGNVYDASSNGLNAVSTGITFATDAGQGQYGEFNNNAYADIQTGSAAANGLPTEAITVATWVRVDAADTWGGFVGCVQDNGSTEYGWVLGTRNQRFSIALRSAGSSALTYLSDNADFALGQWYHVAATYDGSTMRLYVDGAQKVSSTAQSGSIAYAGSGWFTLGRYKDDDEDFRHDGGLNDVLVMKRAMSASEIASLASTGGSTPPPAPSGPQPLARYKLDGNGFDATGNGFDGVASGVSFAPNATFGTVGEFGNTGYIDVQTGSAFADGLPTQAITVATWVRVDNSDTWGGFAGAVHDNGFTEYGWVLGTRGKRFSFALAGGGNGLTYLQDGIDFNNGQWYHVVGTYDGSTMRLYVNGQQKSSSTAQSGDIAYYSSGWFTLGRYRDSNEDHRHDGGLEDLRIYGEALSASEVSSLYNANTAARQLQAADSPTQTLEEEGAPLQAKLFPNPSSGTFNLAFNKPLETEAQVRVLNNAGVEVATATLPVNSQGTTLELSTLPMGTYVVQLLMGETMAYHLIIKQ